MPRKTDGSGTLYLRGDIWWVKIRVDGRPVYESSKSTKKSEAIKLRDKMLAKKSRGELSGGSADKVLIGELLDDVLKSDVALRPWDTSAARDTSVRRPSRCPTT